MHRDLKQFYNDHFRATNSQLSQEAQAKVKGKILANLNTTVIDEPTKSSNNLLITVRRFLFMPYVVVPLMLLLFVGTSTVASAQSQPGDKLYSVKRQVEKLRLLAATNDEARTELELNFAERRLQEARLIEEKRLLSEQHDDGRELPDPVKEVDLSDLLNSDDDNDTEDNDEDRNLSRKQRQENKMKSKLREDAKTAVERLSELKKTYIEQGQLNRARQIDVLLRQYIKPKNSHREDDNIQRQEPEREQSREDIRFRPNQESEQTTVRSNTSEVEQPEIEQPEVELED